MTGYLRCRCCRVLLSFAGTDIGPLCTRCAANQCPRGRSHRRDVKLLDGRVVKR